MSKRVAIWAYLANNLGDDLFVQMLCLRYPDVQFYMQRLRFPNKALRALENLHISSTLEDGWARDDSIGAPPGYYDGFDATVLIGGSIFTQHKYVPDHEYDKRLRSVKNLFVIGANFGPYEDQCFLNQYRSWFAEIKDICFRDSASVSYFPELKTVRWAPDVVFGYPVDIRPDPQVSGVVVISLINCDYPWRPQWLKQYAEKYESGLAAVCLEFAHRGYRIDLIPFCVAEGDMVAAQRIIERCLAQEEINIRISPYTGDISATLNELAEADYIIATRFHSMILGWVCGKPTYPIIYNRKQMSVIRDMDFQGAYCRVGEFDPDNAGVIADTLICSGKFHCNSAIERAQEQFLALDRFLKP